MRTTFTVYIIGIIYVQIKKKIDIYLDMLLGRRILGNEIKIVNFQYDDDGLIM